MVKTRWYLMFVAGLFASLIGCSSIDDPVAPQEENGLLFSTSTNALLLLASSDSLDLTPEQKEKLEAAFKRHQAAVQTLMEQYKNGAISREDFKARLGELEKQLDEEIKSILTPAQYEKWKERKGRLDQNGGIPYPLFAPLEYLAQALSLTPEQVQKAKAIVEQAIADLQKAFQTIQDRDQLRKAVEEILARTDRQFRSILTPEQAAKYDQLKQKQPHDQIPYPLFAPLEHLARALNLSADQIRKATAIVEQAQQELRQALQTIQDRNQLKAAFEEILRRRTNSSEVS